MCSRVQSCKLVHMSGVYCHLLASSTNSCAFVYFTVLCRVQPYSIFISIPGCLEAGIKAVVIQVVLLGRASCCTILLYFSRYDSVRLKMFILWVFLMYYLYEKYYKPLTGQYYIASYVSLGTQANFIGLTTNWTCKCTHGTELIHIQGTYNTKNTPQDFTEPGSVDRRIHHIRSAALPYFRS